MAISEQHINFFIDHSKYIQFLPEMERDIIESLLKDWSQKEVAAQYGITQGAVSSRLKRAVDRLPYLKFIKEFDLGQIDRDLGHLFYPLDMEIMKSIADTSCQTDTARRVNGMFNLTGKQRMNQVKVRHRFEKSLKVLERMSRPAPSPLKEIYTKYLFFFKYVKHNLYKLHEVKLPHHGR